MMKVLLFLIKVKKKMKIIIVGIRDINDEVWVYDILNKCYVMIFIIEVILGIVRGFDIFGEIWVVKNNIF